jgi:hypothetical protein
MGITYYASFCGTDEAVLPLLFVPSLLMFIVIKARQQAVKCNFPTINVLVLMFFKSADALGHHHRKHHTKLPQAAQMAGAFHPSISPEKQNLVQLSSCVGSVEAVLDSPYVAREPSSPFSKSPGLYKQSVPINHLIASPSTASVEVKQILPLIPCMSMYCTRHTMSDGPPQSVVFDPLDSNLVAASLLPALEQSRDALSCFGQSDNCRQCLWQL